MICPCLNMKMKRARRPKKTTTLSIVLSMTTSCLWSPGKNLTSLSILNNLNVLRTVRPEPSSFIPNNRPLIISTPLKEKVILFFPLHDTHILYPKQTRKPSKTLKPSLMYWIRPNAAIFINISIVKMKLKTRLLVSTIFESVSGWLWCSIPMLQK